MSTIQELFFRGQSLLAGIPQPSLEAKLLLLKCASIGEETFLSYPGLDLSKEVERRYLRQISKRLAGFPLVYLTGEKEFWSLSFKIEPGVFIPRPETELLVEKALEFSSGGEELIVDIGTGSGNIAVALATELPQARIVATDTSRKALRVSGENALAQGVSNVQFISGSLFSPLEKLGLRGMCDMVISNPPYVSRADWESLPPEIKTFEPRRALYAGETGLEVVERLVRESLPFLKPGGSLLLEIGDGQERRVLSLFGDCWQWVDSFPDLRGVPRVVAGRKS